MRRADRLFRIVQLLRREHATTATALAKELEVSERTVYRDVQDLVLSGVPIRGEAGVGYALPAHFDLPPLMFDATEIEALVLGMRMVEGWSDEALAKAARSALRKIEHVLPEASRAKLAGSRLFVPDFHVGKHGREILPVLRKAVEERVVLGLEYADEAEVPSRRDVRPLGLFYWGSTWTLTAWCELRRDFRAFRIDRIKSATPSSRRFHDEAGRGLEDFLARMTREAAPAETPAARRPPAKGPTDPEQRQAWRAFQQLGSVGPATAADFLLLGFRAIAELRGQDPIALYGRICELTGERHDPCVEDAFRCAIAQAEHADLPDDLRQWFRWTPLRGRPAGTLPEGFRPKRRPSR